MTQVPAGPDADPVLLTVRESVAWITLNRPHRRNALSSQLIATLPIIASEAARRADVGVLVITGADPAFCAGLDLNELGSTGDNLGLPESPPYAWPWEVGGKPVIGAINGPAVAGGFELMLHCDILVASDRARFADTHARIGQVPGAGLTVNLPRLIGMARAKEMSFTGNFIDADTALDWGIVSRVVPHDQLDAAVGRLAADIVSNDQEAVVAINRLYAATEVLSYQDALRYEEEAARHWQAEHNDPSVVAGRRESVIARAHGQIEVVS